MKVIQVFYDKGQIIYNEGDETEAILLIEDGEIEIFRQRGDRQISIQFLKPGQFSGETGIIEGTRHPMSARAHTDLSCLAIPKEEFENELNQVSPLIRRVMLNLVLKLRTATNRAYGRPNR